MICPRSTAYNSQHTTGLGPALRAPSVKPRPENQILIAFVQLIAFEIGGILLVLLVLDGVLDQTDEQIERVGEVQNRNCRW